MRTHAGAIFAPAVFGLLAMATLSPAEARDRTRDYPAQDAPWGPSVGRNAAEAIGSGLAEQGAGWIDAMARFYADPHIKNREYFDDYRRPTYGWPRTDRRRSNAF